MSEDFLVARKDGIATITINRPQQRNAISYSMWRELREIAEGLHNDPSLRLVVFTGAGDQAFSAGGDIRDFETYRSNSAQASVYNTALEEALRAVEDIPCPTISVVKGYCVGGGCELAVFTDLRVATDGSRFGVTPARLGIVLEPYALQRLIQLLGPGGAKVLLLTARFLDAHQALRMGLVDWVLPAEEIDAFAEKLITEVSALAPFSHRSHKRLIRSILENPGLRNVPSEERELVLRAFDTQDFHEGRRAFQEKRPPVFKGL
ncbi:MAG: enoyl-CoA hydratase/isomerase family protein [Chloroflexi bacterium]|nr:enoyl-CoA hydratase/isomerase family protein [Chloroflexota bacterium]